MISTMKKVGETAIAAVLAISLIPAVSVPIAISATPGIAYAATSINLHTTGRNDVIAQGIVFDKAPFKASKATVTKTSDFDGVIETDSDGSVVAKVNYTNSKNGKQLPGSVTFKWTDIGYDADGTRVDCEINISNIEVKGISSNVDRKISVANAAENGRFYCTSWDTESGKDFKYGTKSLVTFKITKTGTNTLASGRFISEISNLNVGESGYDEGVEFVSGVSDAYVESDHWLNIENNNTKYTADGSHKDDATDVRCGVIAVFDAQSQFRWQGARCGTTLMSPFGSSTITASAGSGGKISPSGSVQVGWKNDKPFTITPNTGYRISSVKVDGSDKGSIASFTFPSVTSSHTISADFVPNTYYLTFDANKGEGEMPRQAFTYDTRQNISKCTFTRPGYAFIGWNTDADNEGDAYADEAEINNLSGIADSETLLFAQWQANGYRVSFDNNQGEGEMDPIDMIYDQPQVLPESTFTKEGYTFGGWSLEGDIESKEEEDSEKLDSDDIEALTATTSDNDDGKDITKDEATDNSENKDGDNEDDSIINDGAEVLNLTDEPNGEVVLYAVWIPNNYLVNYDSNGGTGDMDSTEAAYDEKFNIKENEFEREGYTFTEWNTEADGEGDVYLAEEEVENLTSEKDGEIDLYAQWEPNAYTVKFDSNGGVGRMFDMSLTYDEPAALTANSFTKEGSAFTGWNTKADGSGDAYEDKAEIENLTSEKDGEVTLYAQWEEIPEGASYAKTGYDHNPFVLIPPLILAIGMGLTYFYKTRNSSSYGNAEEVKCDE